MVYFQSILRIVAKNSQELRSLIPMHICTSINAKIRSYNALHPNIMICTCKLNQYKSHVNLELIIRTYCIVTYSV